MSTELEQRLECFLRDAPEPDAEVGERAFARAVLALRPAGASHRRVRTAVLAFAAVGVVLAVSAGSLAAAGALHVSFGSKPRPVPHSTLTLPRGAAGVLAVVDNRLSVVTKSGFRLQGLPVTSAALSPHALYVAAGIGHSLVAMRPDGKRAWSHPAGGTVVSLAWAPDGFRIAYVVRTRRGLVLHVIWGNGTNDTVLDRSVRGVAPSWRTDSLAFAYVGAGGHAIVYDLAHQKRSVLAVAAPVTGVAFSPTGASVAVEQPSGIWLLHQSGAEKIRGNVESFGWLGSRLAVVLPVRRSAELRLYSPAGVAHGSKAVHGIVVAVTPKLVVVQRNRQLLAGDTVLLTVPQGATVRSLEIR